MVVRLSLYGLVSNSDTKISLHTFRALSGNAGLEYHTSQLIWEPKFEYKPVLQAGQVNQIEQYRMFTECSGLFIYPDDDPSTKEWTLEVREVPEPGRNQKTVLQEVLPAKICEGNLFKTLDNLGYQYKSQYWIHGHQFIVGQLVIRMFRIYSKPDELIDSSETYTVHAYADVDQLADRNSIDKASAQLERLQADLKGIIPLEMPSRVPFDTRVRR